jgi:hypothetical protein
MDTRNPSRPAGPPAEPGKPHMLGDECRCGADYINLDQIVMQLNCAACGGWHSAVLANVAGVTLTLECLNEHHGVAQRANGERLAVARKEHATEILATVAAAHRLRRDR